MKQKSALFIFVCFACILADSAKGVTLSSKFIKEFGANILNSLVARPTAAQSPQAMRETQAYAAIKAQQDASVDTRLLEDELVALQDEIRNIDKATVEQRQEVSMKLASKKLEAYPEKKHLPIIIVPKDPSDSELLEATKMEKLGFEDLAKGIMSPCAVIANELQSIKNERQAPDNDFYKQAGVFTTGCSNFNSLWFIDALKTLPLKDRLKFDEEKVFYWKQKAKTAQHLIKQDQLALKLPASLTSVPTPTSTASGLFSQIGSSLLSGALKPNTPQPY